MYMNFILFFFLTLRKTGHFKQRVLNFVRIPIKYVVRRYDIERILKIGTRGGFGG